MGKFLTQNKSILYYKRYLLYKKPNKRLNMKNVYFSACFYSFVLLEVTLRNDLLVLLKATFLNFKKTLTLKKKFTYLYSSIE
jgi:hypothetical protein